MVRLQRWEALTATITELMSTQSASQVVADGQANGLPCAVLNTPGQFLVDPQAKLRGASGETIWLAPHRTSPYKFFQYWMNVPDHDVERFLLQLTLLPVESARAVAAAHAAAPEKREGQRVLAREVTTLVHGGPAAAAAEAASDVLFGSPLEGVDAATLETVAAEVPTTAVTGVGRRHGPRAGRAPGGDGPRQISQSDARRLRRSGRRVGQQRPGRAGAPRGRRTTCSTGASSCSAGDGSTTWSPLA